jgi:hypothetical protein
VPGVWHHDARHPLGESLKRRRGRPWAQLYTFGRGILNFLRLANEFHQTDVFGFREPRYPLPQAQAKILDVPWEWFDALISSSDKVDFQKSLSWPPSSRLAKSVAPNQHSFNVGAGQSLTRTQHTSPPKQPQLHIAADSYSRNPLATAIWTGEQLNQIPVGRGDECVCTRTALTNWCNLENTGNLEALGALELDVLIFVSLHRSVSYDSKMFCEFKKIQGKTVQ